MSKRIRQYMGILAAVAAYYIVHEGAHLITALSYGVFKRINFMGLGIQIDVYADRMTDTQLGVFCLAGPLAALAAGWVLIAMAKPICAVRSKGKRKSHPRFVCLCAMCYNLCNVTESLGYSLRLSVIWRLCT